MAKKMFLLSLLTYFISLSRNQKKEITYILQSFKLPPVRHYHLLKNDETSNLSVILMSFSKSLTLLDPNIGTWTAVQSKVFTEFTQSLPADAAIVHPIWLWQHISLSFSIRY